MNITVLLFAAHREAFGHGRIVLSIAENARVSEVYDELVRRQPQMAKLRPYTRFAINRDISSADATLHADDELALLQPVSGG